ncbi:MAG TPA: response regulator [Chitinophagaceae bacterium]|nr:response regulator [Chitinophagaceae bacterium]
MLILVVDGSMLVTERMTEGLSEVRNISSIHRALFYEEAQKLLKENKYDIVVVDNDFPGNESLQLLKEIKIVSEKSRVIVLFTQTSNYIQDYYRSLGVDFFFDKYYDLEKVYEIIDGM